jgi:hypothetical protein
VSYVGRAPLGELDAALLRALHEQYPDGEHFDEINISIDAWRRPELLAALAFLDPKIDRRRRALTRGSTAAVQRWIDRTEGRPLDGLYLRRDRVGWSYVEVVGATGGHEP